MNEFDAVKIKNQCVEWIRNWFSENGDGCNAVIGISGGKDSSVVAALCVEALGKDRVIGVLMPQGKQHDIDDSYQIVQHLGIKHYKINIGPTVADISLGIRQTSIQMSNQAGINLPARIRMATLYAVSQSCNGRVANTCNLSEKYIGYSTRWGDSVGDFCPLVCLTSEEVSEIGLACGLPRELTHKVPSDGLCGKTDEDNFGFTYAELNRYIREGVCNDEAARKRIDDLHSKNYFKNFMPPIFYPEW